MEKKLRLQESRIGTVPCFDSLSKAITALYGEETRMVKKTRVYGGDINDARCLNLSNGNRIFMKTNEIRNISFFVTEVTGLSLLHQTGCIGVPEVFAYGQDQEEGYSFLLMEYLTPIRKNSQYWQILGQELATMHLKNPVDILGETGRNYGLFEDNYIGASPQKNEFRSKWVDFYRDCRLIPQMNWAKEYMNVADLKRFDYLICHLEKYIRDLSQPSLLHGDLWGGNVMAGKDGKAWLIDPAVYLGDCETDLAMTQLFGSFPLAFYEAYHSVNPIDREFGQRKEIYHLYHMLNHLNLFGRGYLSEVCAILQYFAGNP